MLFWRWCETLVGFMGVRIQRVFTLPAAGMTRTEQPTHEFGDRFQETDVLRSSRRLKDKAALSRTLERADFKYQIQF